MYTNMNKIYVAAKIVTNSNMDKIHDTEYGIWGH